MAEKWTATSGGVGLDVDDTAGRSGGPAVKINGVTSISAGWLHKTVPAASTLGVGFRLKQAGFNAVNAGGHSLVYFRDGSSAQCAIGIDGSGKLQAYKGDLSTTIGSASTNAFDVNTLYHVEVKVLIHASAGTIEVRVNGTSTGWLNLTGVDTQATANNTANSIYFPNARAQRHYCDFVMWDTSGSVNNDFLGEVNVDAFLPTGAGNYAQLTPSAGANYACVDEADPNTTDYVSSSTAGHIDTYVFADMVGNNPNIKAVVNNLWALKSDSGVIYAKSKYRRGGADYTGNNLTPSTTYQCLQQIYETDPATSAAWIKGDVNSAEFGVEVSAS